MSRSRPASNPISYHKHTKQYYVTRDGKRIYLGSDKNEALKKYHRLGLGLELSLQKPASPVEITIKELVNRLLANSFKSAKSTLLSLVITSKFLD